MKVSYGIVIGFIVFWIALLLTAFIGEAIGPGSNEIGYVLVALALLTAVIIVCTLFMVDAIKGADR